jgi:PTS system mannose-specific IID component
MDKVTFRKLFWGCRMMSLCFSQVKMMTVGTCRALIPWLLRLYPEKEKFTEAMVRHQPFFNCTPETAYFIIGLVAAMEKEHAADPDNFPAEPISAIKAALMGPLSGVGDAIFWVAVRTIATSVAVSLAKGGSILAPFVFLAVYHGFSFPTRWFGLKYGYELGGKFVETAYESGIVDMLTGAATSIGLIMVGGMVANFVNLNTIIVLAGAGTKNPTLLQASLDNIFPKLLPLTVSLVTLWLVRKRVNASVLIIGMIVIGIVGVYLGIF